MANNMKKQTAGAKPDPYAAVRELYDWIYCLLFALVVCVVLFAFVFHAIDVVGTSMVPTLHNGDKMLVSGLFYKPKAGDVIVFKKLDFIGPKTVPEGCVFVMGDNRNASVDSRKSEISMLDTRLILGRAYAVIYPLSVLRVIK